MSESVLKLCREAQRFKKIKTQTPLCSFFPSLSHHLLSLQLALSRFYFCPSLLCSPFPLISSSSSVPPQVQPVVSRSSLTTVPCGVNREEETGRSHSTKKGAFHEVFNLQESERPLPGKRGHCSHKKNMNLLNL